MFLNLSDELMMPQKSSVNKQLNRQLDVCVCEVGLSFVQAVSF